MAQTSLGRSNSQLQTALSRLSTGFRINSGKDDPAGLIASENLRRDITAANKAISNSERANQLIATADSALAQISSLLNDIRGLVTEAANSGVLSVGADRGQPVAGRLVAGSHRPHRLGHHLPGPQDARRQPGLHHQRQQPQHHRPANQQRQPGNRRLGRGCRGHHCRRDAGFAERLRPGLQRPVHAWRQTFTLTAAATGETFNNVRVDIASGAATGASYAAGVLTLTLDNTDAAITAAAVNAAFAADGTFTSTTSGAGTIDGTTTAAQTGITTAYTVHDLTFQLSGDNGAQVFSFNDGATAAQIASAVNLVSDSTGISAAAASGAVHLHLDRLRHRRQGPGRNHFRIRSGNFAASLSGTSSSGTDIAATVNGYTASGKGNTISLNNRALNLDVTVSAGSTTDLAFTITGGGALFQIGPNVNSGGQVRIGVGAVNTGKLGGNSGRLYELKSGNTKDLNTDPTSTANVVDQAITRVTGLRGRFGAFQHATLDTNIASLKDTISNLSEAESSIRDADFAKESAALTRAQILVQSGTAVLQIANQNPQQVLALLRG